MPRRPGASGDDLPLQLKSGAYSAADVIANAQRCLNLYPEQNPAETTPEAPFTHYLTPGLTPLVQLADKAQMRGLYRTSQGDLYAVCGSTLYYVDDTWLPQFVATLPPQITNQVKMTDNGRQMVVVDGTPTGVQVDLATRTASGITQTNAAGINGFGFAGANYVDYIDTFIVGNTPGTPDWFSSASNEVVFDALSFASKSGYPDPAVAVVVARRYVWIIGELTSELWYDAGNTVFPFAILDGPYIEHGCAATYSVCKFAEGVIWLAQDKQGKVLVLLGEGYSAQRVSTFAIEYEWSNYATVSDAVGMVYMQRGHLFYVLTFPTAGKTWGFDYMTRQWHERCTLDASGNEALWRGNCMAFAYGVNVVGDYENGMLYALDPTALTDNGTPIKRLRGFPHLVAGLNRIRHTRVLADVDCGNYSPPIQISNSGGAFLEIDASGENLEGDPTGFPLLIDTPKWGWEVIINLRWSNTRGHDWESPIGRSMGNPGEYRRNPQWRRLGMARDRVYEIYWSAQAITALNGLYLEVEEAGS